MITREMHDAVYAGLAARGFGPLNGQECSRGGCHTPDEKHYILMTDGMIIYSSTHDCYQPQPDTVIKEWFFDEFNFTELDACMGGKVLPLIGRRIVSVEGSNRGDDGLKLTFGDGTILEFAYSSQEGTTWLNGKEI